MKNNPPHNLKIRFHLFGLILYCLQALPNLLWLIFPPANDPLAYNYSPYAWLNALEFLSGSADFTMVGAYPIHQRAGVCRDDKSKLELAMANIAKVPLPKNDPLNGNGGLMLEWK